MIWFGTFEMILVLSFALPGLLILFIHNRLQSKEPKDPE